jgi:hypothetical protein
MMRLTLALAALLLLVPAVADDLGRLFTTPEQRAQLTQGLTSSGAPSAAPSQSGAKVQGVIRRGDGTALVWVNGKPLGKGQSFDGARVLDANRRRAVVQPPKGDPITLKPGQSLSDDGRVQDAWEQRPASPPEPKP